MRKLDISGHVYGRLTVIREAGHIGKKISWLCKCTCGNDFISTANKLRIGATNSCGCLRKETTARLNRTHGMTNSREYQSWMHARSRCHDENNAQYKDYGARGIRMHPSWRKDFAAFYRAVGPCPPGKFLERIDNDRGYEPGNVRWATRSENNCNRRTNRVYEFDGRRMVLAEWARVLRVDYRAIYRLLDKYKFQTIVEILTICAQNSNQLLTS